jgi:cobalt-zinc-cadmium efflux system outer membrane protein
VANAQLQYNAMQIGPNELFAARQTQVETYRGYLLSIRDYWFAVAELERVLGGHFPVKRGAPKEAPPPPASEHHHHE